MPETSIAWALTRRFIVLAVASVAVALIYYCLDAPLQREIAAGPGDLAAARSALRERGYPVIPSQLQAPAPPPAMNAAPVYARLTAILAKRPISADLRSVLPVEGEPVTAEQLAGMRRILMSRPEVMALVHQAADRPGCVFHRNWNLGPWVTFPELSAIRTSETMLFIESTVLVSEGRDPQAVEDQQRGFRVSAHAGSDPVMAAYLVSQGCESLALRGLTSILYAAGPDAKVDTAVLRTLLSRPQGPSLARAIAGESATIRAGIEIQALGHRPIGLPSPETFAKVSDTANMSGRLIPPPRSMRLERRSWVIGLVNGAEAQQARDTLEIVHAAGCPYPERTRLLREIAVKIRNRYQNRSVLSQLTHPGAGLVDIATISLVNACSADAGVVEQERVVEAGGAVLDYRAIHGVYPQRLGQALPASTGDPGAGVPLSYQLERNGFRVTVNPGDSTSLGALAKLITFRYPPSQQR